jgi:ATPase subunit of ABC transporter with duplicated ATPase domains
MHEPDSGEIIRDQNLKIGYYSQEFETFDMDMPMIDFVNKQTQLSDHIIRPMLARFLFTGQKVFQKIGTLSGGEKTRLSIALILLHPYNLLVLDEPTTYLDVLSQRIILESLKQYTGTIIIVSHTEEFITELNPNKALILPDTRLQDWSPELIEKIGEV